jgi:hypothetical protein
VALRLAGSVDIKVNNNKCPMEFNRKLEVRYYMQNCGLMKVSIYLLTYIFMKIIVSGISDQNGILGTKLTVERGQLKKIQDNIQQRIQNIWQKKALSQNSCQTDPSEQHFYMPSIFWVCLKVF